MAVAASLSVSGAARADELVFAIVDGRVSLTAADTPLADVLAAWSRAGDTRFEGVGELGSVAVTLRLEGVAEREALRLLLRPVAGFLAAPRGPRSSGASIYDRVKIRVARRSPPPPPAGASAARRRPLPGPVREAPGMSAAEQRERLQRLMRPPPAVEAVAQAGAPPPLGGPAYAPTTPRPGMVAEPEPPAPR